MLFRFDLENQISKEISIDKYEPVINEAAIVTSFKSKNSTAARDFKSFFVQSEYPIIHASVSKAINDEGFYLIFFEWERNEKFPKVFMKFIENLYDVTRRKEWTLNSNSINNEPLSLELLQQSVSLMPHLNVVIEQLGFERENDILFNKRDPHFYEVLSYESSAFELSNQTPYEIDGLPFFAESMQESDGRIRVLNTRTGESVFLKKKET